MIAFEDAAVFYSIDWLRCLAPGTLIGLNRRAFINLHMKSQDVTSIIQWVA